MNIKTFIVFIACIFLSSNALLAQEAICPPLHPDPDRAEELVMHENEFTKEKYISSLDFVRNEFPRRILSYEKTSEFEDSPEFWIGYYNSLTFIEGYVLKQAAISEIKTSKTKGSAVKEFCTFLEEAAYTD